MPLASPILVNLKPYQKYIKKHTECSFQYFSNQIWCITDFTRMPLQLWELNCENDFSFYVQLQRSQYLKVRVVCEPCGGPHISPTIRLALMDVQVLPEQCNALHIGAITQFVHCIPHFGQQSFQCNWLFLEWFLGHFRTLPRRWDSFIVVFTAAKTTPNPHPRLLYAIVVYDIARHARQVHLLKLSKKNCMLYV